MSKKIKYLVAPNPLDKNLTKEINGFDESFKKTKTKVIIEKDLTIYLNNQEIVTLMTVGDHPEYLAVGYLLNQNMLKKTDKIKKIEYRDGTCWLTPQPIRRYTTYFVATNCIGK